MKISVKVNSHKKKIGILGICCFTFIWGLHSVFYNSGAIYIKIDQILHHKEQKLVNTESGKYVLNGQVVFEDDILNFGEMNCGDCNSGVAYFTSPDSRRINIEGTSEIVFHDLVLDNSGGLYLQNQVKISDAFLFNAGMVSTDRMDPKAILHFEEGAIVVGISNEKFVDGYAAISGSEYFELPIGEGSVLAKVGIQNFDGESPVNAAYFHKSSDSLSEIGGPFPKSQRDTAAIDQIIDTGFWDVNGSDLSALTFFWDENMGLANYGEDLERIRLIGWKDGMWTDLERISYEGTLSNGRISIKELIPDAYEAFTIGFAKSDEQNFFWKLLQAQQLGGRALIFWEIAYPEATNNFQISRSVDSINFDLIEQVDINSAATQGKLFSLEDWEVLNLNVNKVFYRIRHAGIDGKTHLSPILELSLENINVDPDSLELTIFPNPAQNEIYIDLDVGDILEEPTGILKIVDMAGSLKEEYYILGQKQFRLPVEDFPSGIYTIFWETDVDQTDKQILILH